METGEDYWILQARLAGIVNTPIIKYFSLSIKGQRMKQLNLIDYDLSSDEDNKPFIGKYHQVLRNRKTQQQLTN